LDRVRRPGKASAQLTQTFMVGTRGDRRSSKACSTDALNMRGLRHAVPFGNVDADFLHQYKGKMVNTDAIEPTRAAAGRRT
jgi:hypothetical protein